MGSRGPVPKRTDHLHGHRSKSDKARVDKVTGAAAESPALGIEVHPLVADWFAALSDGPEAAYYTPAMWQRARIVAKMLSGVLEAGRPSSQMYAALQADMKSLLVDAGELASSRHRGPGGRGAGGCRRDGLPCSPRN
jgi:hypothetical protein